MNSEAKVNLIQVAPTGRTRGLRRVGVILIIVIIAVSALLWAGSTLLVRTMYTHRVERLETTPGQLGLAAETLELVAADGTLLQAWWVPAVEARAIIILLHGMDGMDASSLLGHSRFLHDEGYATIALDMRAHGRSGGERIGVAIEEPQDVTAALDWVAAQPELAQLPVAVLGLSMGGATAIRTAAARPDVDAVISVSAFSSIDAATADVMEGMMGMPPWLVGSMMPWMKLGLATIYGVSPSAASPLADISAVAPRPLLLVHGTADDQIPVSHAYRLAGAAGEGTTLWIVEGAGHVVYEGDATGPEDAFYRERLLAFLKAGL